MGCPPTVTVPVCGIFSSPFPFGGENPHKATTLLLAPRDLPPVGFCSRNKTGKIPALRSPLDCKNDGSSSFSSGRSDFSSGELRRKGPPLPFHFFSASQGVTYLVLLIPRLTVPCTFFFSSHIFGPRLPGQWDDPLCQALP